MRSIDINSVIMWIIFILAMFIYAVVLLKELSVKVLRNRISELEAELSDALEQIFELESDRSRRTDESFNSKSPH